MLKQGLRRVASLIAPETEKAYSEWRWLRQHARELRDMLAGTPDLGERVQLARSHQHLRSNQKQAEALSLLNELSHRNVRIMGEIGADRGGTLAILASIADPKARILSVDIHYPDNRRSVYPCVARHGQCVTCLEADSHAPSTRRRVEKWLGSERFDFLFVDGDHSYAGVKADYEMYAPLVRPGGVLAFHDIVPDFRTRFGRPTSSDVGEVPRFWKELRGQMQHWKELIEDPAQDGYGIGIVYLPGDAT